MTTRGNAKALGDNVNLRVGLPLGIGPEKGKGIPLKPLETWICPNGCTGYEPIEKSGKLFCGVCEAEMVLKTST